MPCDAGGQGGAVGGLLGGLLAIALFLCVLFCMGFGCGSSLTWRGWLVALGVVCTGPYQREATRSCIEDMGKVRAAESPAASGTFRALHICFAVALLTGARQEHFPKAVYISVVREHPSAYSQHAFLTRG